jgi:ABC-type polysaccharide/polyol phosphate transport system ATPase subunit
MLYSKKPEKGLRMSSNDIAIRVSNLSKCYQIYDTPRDRLKQFIMPRIRRVAGKQQKQYFREFWALKDVSFEVKKGETVGIIGRNGSGKSTLLQMICGTLTPTTGSIQTNGRVAALLELGSGFNPEFTGRENVYMNAAVLGLSKEEVDARFNDIAVFADIGDFIEQPVKTYSSGMMVRLAFAVAIHVEPDILIVDEALAVGDIVFQMKCLDKMEKIRSCGTTILFVSHSLEQVKRFCTSAVWLEHGKVQRIGESNYVSDQYRDASLRSSATDESHQFENRVAHKVGAPAMVSSVIVSATKLAPFDPLSVRITYFVGEHPLPKLLLGVAIRDAKGTYIFGPNTHLDKVDIPHSHGTHVVEYVIARLPLLTGTFVFDVGLFTDAGLVCIDYLGAAAEINVVAEYFSEGLVYIEHEWRTISHG